MQDIIAALAYTDYAKEFLIKFASVLVDHFVKNLFEKDGEKVLAIRTLRATNASQLSLSITPSQLESNKYDVFIATLDNLLRLKYFLQECVLPYKGEESDEAHLEKHRIQLKSFLYALGLHFWPRFSPLLKFAVKILSPLSKEDVSTFSQKIVPNLRHFLTQLHLSGLMPSTTTVDSFLSDFQPVDKLFKETTMQNDLIKARKLLLSSDKSTRRLTLEDMKNDEYASSLATLIDIKKEDERNVIKIANVEKPLPLDTDAA